MTARTYSPEELTLAAYLGFLAAVLILTPILYFLLGVHP